MIFLSSILKRRETECSSLFRRIFEKTKWLVELPTSTPTDSISISLISMLERFVQRFRGSFKGSKVQGSDAEYYPVTRFGVQRFMTFVLLVAGQQPEARSQQP